MAVLCKYAIATYFRKCAYGMFFPHKLAFSTAILIFFVFLFQFIFAVIRKWQMKVQPTPTILAHFQGWANCVTTAHPINTHGYHNHVCSCVSCGYTYDVGFMRMCNSGLFLHISATYLVFIRSTYFL